MTRLALHGGPGRPYGAFIKVSAGASHDPGLVTRLALCGTPGGRYGAFLKSPASGGAGAHTPGLITRLALHAGPGARYGVFAKSPADIIPPIDIPPVFAGSSGGVMPRDVWRRDEQTYLNDDDDAAVAISLIMTSIVFRRE